MRTLCAVLHATGCRISEALALTAQQIDLTERVIVFESLKKRKRGVCRASATRTAGHARHGAQPRGAAARMERRCLAARPHDSMTAGARGHTGRRHSGRPPRKRQGSAAWVRGAGSQQRHRPKHGAEMAGTCPAHHHGDLRERRGGGGAEHRFPDVVTGPRPCGRSGAGQMTPL